MQVIEITLIGEAPAPRSPVGLNLGFEVNEVLTPKHVDAEDPRAMPSKSRSLRDSKRRQIAQTVGERRPRYVFVDRCCHGEIHVRQREDSLDGFSLRPILPEFLQKVGIEREADRHVRHDRLCECENTATWMGIERHLDRSGQGERAERHYVDTTRA